MESRWYDSRGYRLHYLAAGEGPPLILIHGFLMRAERWAANGYIDSLAADFRVVAPDLLGHGQSDKPHEEAPHSVAGLVEDIEALARVEGFDAYHLWGYSLGARVAASAAQSHPDRVLSLTAGGQVPLYTAPPPTQDPEAIGRALRAGGWEAFWPLLFGDAVPAQDVRELLQRDQDVESLAAGFVVRFAPHDPGPAFPGPKLCYLGSLEPMREEWRAVAERIGAEFHVIDDRDHARAFQDRAAAEPLFRSFVSAAVG
jgi:pimeloyl-ACP methyl ester carboxylesterase